MTKQLEIYKCEVCGNIVEMLHPGKGELICCEEPMKLYKENTVDAAVEKHVPVVIRTDSGVSAKIGIENTGRTSEVGSFEQMIDIVKRTTGTEPIINWAHIHARGSGSLTTKDDFDRIMQTMRREFGLGWTEKAFFLFSGASYGPSGFIRQIPIGRSDMNLEHTQASTMSIADTHDHLFFTTRIPNLASAHVRPE